MAEEAKIKGNEQYAKGNYDQAVEHYSDAIEKNPDEPAYYGNRAAALVMLGKYDLALKDCRSGLDLQPTFVKLLMRAGKCALVLGNLKDSQLFYREAKRLDPDSETLKADMDTLECALENEHMYRQCHKNGRYPQASYFLSQLLQTVTHCPSLQLVKAQLILDSGQPKVALEYLNSLAPCVEVQVKRGEAMYYAGMGKEARAVLREVLRQEPGNTQSRELLHRLREMERAKDKGNRLFKDKRNKEAIEVYSQALVLDGKHRLFNSLILGNRAAAHMAEQNYLQALDDCNSALSLNPNYTRAYLRRANIHMELESYEEALQDYNRVKDLDPRTANIDTSISLARQRASNAGKKDYYKILEVEKNVTEEQLKRAYRQKALRCHPDKNADTPEKSLQSEKLFKDVNEAYAVLSDPVKRQKYDAGLLGVQLSEAARGGKPIDPMQVFQMFFGRSGFPDLYENRPFPPPPRH